MLEDLIPRLPEVQAIDFLPGALLGYFGASWRFARGYAAQSRERLYAIGTAASLFVAAGVLAYRQKIGIEIFTTENLSSAFAGLIVASTAEKISDWRRERKRRQNEHLKSTSGIQTFKGENRITKYLTSDTIPGIDYDPRNN